MPDAAALIKRACHAWAVRRSIVVGGLIAVALVVVVVVVALVIRTDDEQRLAVQWESIEVSPDRRTITVETSYPVDGFCVKDADGIDVTVNGTVATVAAWMTGPAPGSGTDCTMECGKVTQTVTLDSPLPASVDFQPVSGAVRGCW